MSTNTALTDRTQNMARRQNTKGMQQCMVCGSSAPITRTSRERTLTLCYYHEYVCAEHLLDPCPECDTK